MESIISRKLKENYFSTRMGWEYEKFYVNNKGTVIMRSVLRNVEDLPSSIPEKFFYDFNKEEMQAIFANPTYYVKEKLLEIVSEIIFNVKGNFRPTEINKIIFDTDGLYRTGIEMKKMAEKIASSKR